MSVARVFRVMHVYNLYGLSSAEAKRRIEIGLNANEQIKDLRNCIVI